jgi:hypothetical protein
VTASERIVWHAGLSADGGLAHGSVSAATSSGDRAAIETATADSLRALDDYNRDVNGPGPSSSIRGSDIVPRDVAYAVAEIARMLRDSGADRSAWRVETAWLAVLAGDIDDIHEHLAEEEAARDA